MNKYRLGPPLVAIALLIGSGVVSAQPAQPPSNATDRVATQIGRLVLQLEQQTDQIQSLQQQLASKQKELDDLKKAEKK